MIKRLTAHKILKEATKSEVAVKYRKDDSLIPSDTDAAKTIYKSVRKKVSRGGSVGKFNRVEDSQFPFEKGLCNYVAINSDEEFIRYSKAATELLVSELKKNKAKAATGGYLVFLEYELNSNGNPQKFFLVALLDDHTVPLFDDDMNLLESAVLDLGHMRHCVRVRMTKLKNNADGVLSFLSKSAKKGAANYFLDFVGCTSATDSRNNSNLLYHRVKEWAEENQIKGYEKSRLYSKVYDFWKHDKSEDSFSLQSMANSVYPDRAEEFLDYLVDDSVGLTGIIPLIKPSDMAKFKTFNSSANGLTLTFDKQEWINKISVSDRKITIMNPPTELVKELKVEKE